MIYELRTYAVPEGRMPELLSLFEEVIFNLFKRSNIKPVSFWVSQNENKFVYVCEFENESAKETAWKIFKADPEWIAAWQERSDPKNPLVTEVLSEILVPVQFSTTTK